MFETKRRGEEAYGGAKDVTSYLADVDLLTTRVDVSPRLCGRVRSRSSSVSPFDPNCGKILNDS